MSVRHLKLSMSKTQQFPQLPILSRPPAYLTWITVMDLYSSPCWYRCSPTVIFNATVRVMPSQPKSYQVKSLLKILPWLLIPSMTYDLTPSFVLCPHLPLVCHEFIPLASLVPAVLPTTPTVCTASSPKSLPICHLFSEALSSNLPSPL